MSKRIKKTKAEILEDKMYRHSPIKNGSLIVKNEDVPLTNYNKILPRLYLGNYKSAKDSSFIKKKIKAVLNCSKDIPNTFACEQSIEYMRIPVDDSLKEIDFEKLYKFSNVAAEFIHKHVDIQKQNIFIHCAMGRQRSVSCVVFYLIKYHKMNPEQACKYVSNKRPEAFHFATSVNFSQTIEKYYKDYCKSKK